MAVLFFIVFIDLVGFGIVIPLLPFYAEHFGASPDRVTLVMASYSLAQFFFAPIWGRLSDRFGRRPILLVSLAFSAASYLWLGFADALWMPLPAFAGRETPFALWAEGAFGWGPRQVGGIFFFVGIVLILVQGGLIGRLPRRFGEARLLLAGSLAIAVGLIGLPLAGS